MIAVKHMTTPAKILPRILVKWPLTSLKCFSFSEECDKSIQQQFRLSQKLPPCIAWYLWTKFAWRRTHRHGIVKPIFETAGGPQLVYMLPLILLGLLQLFWWCKWCWYDPKHKWVISATVDKVWRCQTLLVSDHKNVIGRGVWHLTVSLIFSLNSCRVILMNCLISDLIGKFSSILLQEDDGERELPE